MPEHVTFTRFVEKHPDLRFIFTGGKGGVGKTISAAGLAHYFVSEGDKVLIASLNPVHSLSSLFGQDLPEGETKDVKGIKNLKALEVDISKRKEKYKSQVIDRIDKLLTWADIPVDTEDFVDIASTNPAFEESAMFDEMTDIILKESEDFDRLIFDTAAVANAVRLLGLSKVYEIWLERMIRSRKESLSLRKKLSFRKKKAEKEAKKDPLIKDLLDMDKKLTETKNVLTDPEATAFFFVTLPLSLPIAVVKRFMKMVRSFDIPAGGIVVNQVIPEETVGEGAPKYIVNKYREQREYLKNIRDEFWPEVRCMIPLYEKEIVGVDMVKRVSEEFRTWRPGK